MSSEGEDSNVQREKVRNLIKKVGGLDELIKMGEIAVMHLQQLIKDEDYEYRAREIKVLGRLIKELGKKGEPAVETLKQVLEDRNPDIRWEAAETLDMLGWKPKNDVERAYYFIARGRLDELARLGEQAVEPLVQSIKNMDFSYGDDIYFRKELIQALGVTGQPKAVESLFSTSGRKYR